MIIQVGLPVRVETWSGSIVKGTITDINISVDKNDPAGELGVSTEELDLDLNYQGSIGYQTDTGNNHWAYFHQVKEVPNV